MVLLLNFAYVIITLIVLAGVWFLRKSPKKVAALGILWALLMITLMAVTPAIPKNSPPKFTPVVYEPARESVQIRDVLRKPEFTPEEQRQRAPELFDWKTRVPSQSVNKPNGVLKQVEAEKGE